MRCALWQGEVHEETANTSFSIGPHLSFHRLLLFYLSRFPLCPVSVLVLLTMNSRLQTQDWASVPCVRSVEMTENIEAVWDFGVPRPEFLRESRVSAGQTSSTLSRVCFQVHTVLGSVCTLAVKTHAAVHASLRTLPSGPRSKLPSAGKGKEPSCPHQDWACSSVNTGWAQVLCHFQKYACLDRETKRSPTRH